MMAERYRGATKAPKRQPLGELRNRANTPPVSQRQAKAGKATVAASSPHSLPHNESLEPNGSLAVRPSHPASPEHKRISQISGENDPDNKRNSAISTTSTNASGRRRKTFIGHWQLGKTIGKGGCSRVRVVRHRYREQFGAVKIITRSMAENTRAQSLANLIENSKSSSSFSAAGHRPIPYGLEREIAVMKLLEHPNIVRLYDVWENRNELYLIMEYVDGGELFHYVDKRKGLPEDETALIFRQIVSALLYCHRLLICHRDLKPENILLDQRTMTVKLIDFGMAALQPEGRLLSTPCGSPHYAAPEVISGKPYDGSMADVWSCGVILYVMLTGTTPFNYSQEGDIRTLFTDIKRANFYMPPDLSLEAQHLLRRIFVANPKKRITMDEVWDHPLLHKFDKMLGLDGPEGTKETAIGPGLRMEQWNVKRIQDIDREILRNMRTLWHSEPEQGLIQKLLSDGVNQEKLFYAALVKHREENLENYVGEPDDMSYSGSDYHHSQPVRPEDAPPMPSRAQRSQSQYSIMNDEHLKSSQNFAGPPPSMSSYDPYRASKNPIVNPNGEYLDVTVHRHGSTGTQKASTGRVLRHPNSMRIEMLRNGRRRSSNISSSSLPRSGRSRASMPRSSLSRNSLNSSMWPSSPPVIATMRPSDVHKRGVSFGHIRRASTTNNLTPQSSTKGLNPITPRVANIIREHQKRLKALELEPDSSPEAHVEQTLKSRKKTAAALETPRIVVRKTETPGHHLRKEIRKHSAELEKACDDAFFRSSVGSDLTAKTSLTDKGSPYDTPPSSVSTRGVGAAEPPAFRTLSLKRPLPDLPRDTPNTYLAKTLEETRDKLAAYRADPDDNTAKFDEVMKMLENILPTATAPSQKRINSAPEHKTSEPLGFLPMISEESDPRSSKEGANWHRSVTAPVQKERLQPDRTIRVVPDGSPGTVAPLNVRKRSNGSHSSDEVPARLSVKPSNETLGRKRPHEPSHGLAPISEDAALDTTKIVRKKRSGWFGLNKKDAEPDQNGSMSPVSTTFSGLDDRRERRPMRVLTKEMPVDKNVAADPPLSAKSSEFPMRKNEKKGLSRWIGRIGRQKNQEGETTMASSDEPTMLTQHSTNSLFSSASPSPSSNDNPPIAAGPGRSWFARFFNIKPAVHILCFSVPRGRARQEMVALLKEWQRHGIRDLEYSRETNTITARVDRANSLDIKPVAFRVELFVVLEHGRKSGLSIARFVQVKGAVSGFRKVLEVVDGVMRGQGWLVEDEEKWRALCDVVSSC